MQIILLPGALAGVALGIAFVALGAMDLSYGAREILGLLVMLAAVLAAQTVTLRRHPLGREAGFGARYFTALLTGLAAALAYGLFAWLYFAVIDPQYLDTFYAEYLARARELALNEGGNEQLVANAEKMKAFVVDPPSQAMVQFGTTLLVSVLAALVTAAFVTPRPRKENA